ncbi:hypothetical protein [Streptomyces sp. NBC_01708]|uniref:hypothetical protein n=1 Tax=Streptomyces sp. NBC_01708 TaxID=2975915 RepID=UPI002E2FB85E|nr:hypothetical protein [Streptomyces sp. NBC_01708]
MKKKHHRPTALNTVGKFRGKIFGAPVAVVATVVDFAYTPSKKGPEDTHVDAPAAPGQARYR